MAEKNQENQENLSQLLQIRRDKLKELQESGNDPFQITKYDVDNTAANIKENFDALEGQEVSVAGLEAVLFSAGSCVGIAAEKNCSAARASPEAEHLKAVRQFPQRPFPVVLPSQIQQELHLQACS